MHKLEITIQRYRSDYGWPVIVDQEDTDVLVHSRSEGKLRIGARADNQELAEWNAALAATFLEPAKYGQILGQALFDDQIVREAFADAVTRANARGGSLRVFLIVEDAALRPLHWERLCAPIGPNKAWDFLALDQRFPFTLYIPSLTAHAFPPIGQHQLRALAVVANVPETNKYGLDHFDAAATVAGIKAALGPIECDILANMPGSDYPLPTLEQLCDHLTKRYYTILHIVAHGQLTRPRQSAGQEADAAAGETAIYLVNADNEIEGIKGTRFLQALSRVQGSRSLPLLTFLSTCESAAPAAEAAGSLGGLAQRLVRDLSLPAVIAMSQKVTISTAEKLAREFYGRLRASGEVDLALTEALVQLHERADVTVPALFGRLGGRALFSPDEQELTHAKIQSGLAYLASLLSGAGDAAPDQAANRGRAPILLPRVAELAGQLHVEPDTLDDGRRQAWDQALAAVNSICEEAIGLNFRALAFGAEPPPYDDRCPFLGLVAFKLGDKEFFFGREPLVRTLTDRLETQPFLPVLGPSGSGKSSLVFAGVLAARRQQVPALQWASFTPGDAPLTNLQTALAELGIQVPQTGRAEPQISPAPKPSLLIIDQFEELFTLSPPGQRQAFVHQLLPLIDMAAATGTATVDEANGASFKIILTMRADFWGDCAYFKPLASAMENHILIGPMNTAELRSAMEQQAKKVGLDFEADLSNEILDDIVDEPGAMPLLQHALRELWYRRHGRKLTRHEYHAIAGEQHVLVHGEEQRLTGIKGAIAHTAEKVYRSLDTVEQNYMRNIFVRLTRLGDETNTSQAPRDTRRRVSLNSLASSNPVVRKLVDSLATFRLLVTNENDEVEVAHEALIRYWSRLRAWLDEDRADLKRLERVSQEAADWQAFERNESYLLQRGTRLESALRLLNHPRLELAHVERAYLEACQIRERREKTWRLFGEVHFQKEASILDVRLSLRDDAVRELASHLLLGPGSETGTRFQFELNYQALTQQDGDGVGYGQQLSQYLFSAPELKDAFMAAGEHAQASGEPLRIHLWLDDGSEALDNIAWESLTDPRDDTPLLLKNHVQFVRMVNAERVRYQSMGTPMALAVVFKGDDDTGMLNVDQELGRAETLLGPIADVTAKGLALTEHDFADQFQALLNEGHDILFLSCGYGMTQVMHELMAGLASVKHLPHLVILTEYPAEHNDTFGRDDSALYAASRAFNEIGIPAVLAVPGKLAGAAADSFIARFLASCYQPEAPGSRGQVEMSLMAARHHCQQLDGWWRPVLYKSIREKRIWYTPGFTGDSAAIWESLTQNIVRQICTPVVGAGLTTREPYQILASLPLPIYISTEPANLLVDALREVGRVPSMMFCPWKDVLEQHAAAAADPDYRPTIENPLVYYPFGHVSEPESLVSSEADFIDFLMAVTNNKGLVPLFVRRGLFASSLLFVGNDLMSREFRFLFGWIEGNRIYDPSGDFHVMQKEMALGQKNSEILAGYMAQGVNFYMGTAEEFAGSLDLEKLNPPGQETGSVDYDA